MKLHMNILVCEECKNDLLKTSLIGIADIIRCERGDEVRRMLFLPYVCLMDRDDPRTLHLSVYLRYLADLRGNRIDSLAPLKKVKLELGVQDLPGLLPETQAKMLREEGDGVARTGNLALGIQITFPGSGIYQFEVYDDAFPARNLESTVTLKQITVLVRD